MYGSKARGLKFKIGKWNVRIWKYGWEYGDNISGRVFFFRKLPCLLFGRIWQEVFNLHAEDEMNKEIQDKMDQRQDFTTLATALIRAFDLAEKQRQAIILNKPIKVIKKGKLIGGDFTFTWRFGEQK